MDIKEVKTRSIQLELTVSEAVTLYKLVVFSGTSDCAFTDDLSERLGLILTKGDIDND